MSFIEHMLLSTTHIVLKTNNQAQGPIIIPISPNHQTSALSIRHSVLSCFIEINLKGYFADHILEDLTQKSLAGCYGDVAHTLAVLRGKSACLTHAHVLHCRRRRSCSMQEGVWLPYITWTQERPHEVLRLRGGCGCGPRPEWVES